MPDVPLRELARGAYSGVREPTRAVVETAAAWDELWRRHARIMWPADPAPRVDFPRERVLAVFMGERPTGGFGVEIRSARPENGRLLVDVRESVPPPDAMVTMALTAPYHVVAAPAGTEPVVFRGGNED